MDVTLNRPAVDRRATWEPESEHLPHFVVRLAGGIIERLADRREHVD